MRTYRGTASGTAIDVVYLDRDDRDVELFARLVRSIRVRDVDEQRISVKPRVRAAQLVMATSMAERAGARVPAVLAVAPMGDDSAIVALRIIPSRLSSCPRSESSIGSAITTATIAASVSPSMIS